MSEFEDRINSVLNDPEQMDKIANLAKSLMGGEAQKADPGDGGMMGKLGELAKGLSGGGQSYATAIGMTKSVISLLLVATVNQIAKTVSDVSLW